MSGDRGAAPIVHPQHKYIQGMGTKKVWLQQLLWQMLLHGRRALVGLVERQTLSDQTITTSGVSKLWPGSKYQRKVSGWMPMETRSRPEGHQIVCGIHVVMFLVSRTRNAIPLTQNAPRASRERIKSFMKHTHFQISRFLWEKIQFGRTKTPTKQPIFKKKHGRQTISDPSLFNFFPMCSYLTFSRKLSPFFRKRILLMKAHEIHTSLSHLHFR